MSGTCIIKVGGGVVAQQDTLWSAVSRLDARVVVVHGGGPQATAMARRLGHEPTIVRGRRVTSDLDLDIVRWTMRGEINLSLAAGAQRHGLKGVGICAADGGMLRVHRRAPWTVDGREVDFGWVGDVDSVDPTVLETLLDAGFLPVVAPLGIDEKGQVYNVNADTVSAAIAAAMDAEQLLLVTESGGLLDASGRPIARSRASEIREGLEAGWIQGGMQVKVQLALEALESCVGRVRILGPDLAGGTEVVP